MILQEAAWYRVKYLLLEQWQWPEEEIFPETPPEMASWHLFLWEDDRGGLPVETVGAGEVIKGPILPSETLPSAVIEDKNDDVVVDMGGDMLRVSLAYWLTDNSVYGFGFDLTKLSLEKSIVKPWEDCDWTLNWYCTWVWVGFDFSDWDLIEEDALELDGSRRKWAWPVRFNKFMTCLNLETVKSVICLQSRLLRCWLGRWELVGGWDKRTRIRCSILSQVVDSMIYKLQED